MSEEDKTQGKILRFSADASSPSHMPSGKKYQLTGKYDRGALTKRISLEGWMDSELRKLFGCKDDEAYDVEIDIDILLEQDENEKCKSMLQKLLKDAKEPIDDFVDDLLKRMQELDKNMSGPVVLPREIIDNN